MKNGPACDGRGGGIRTPDPLVPNQMRYQAALRPDCPAIIPQELVPNPLTAPRLRQKLVDA